MTVFSVSFSSAPSTGVAKDIFQVQASTTCRLRVSEVYIGQSTADYTGSTEVEMLAITIHRGSTLDASVGSTSVPVNLDPRSPSTATFTTLLNSSSPGSSGTSAKLLYSGVMITGQPFVWRPYRDGKTDERPLIGLGERLQIRASASNAAITLNGSLILQQVGKV